MREHRRADLSDSATEAETTQVADQLEALQNRVDELEATIEGLTEELVDSNERVRLLERALGETDEHDSSGALSASRQRQPHQQAASRSAADTPASEDSTAESDQDGTLIEMLPEEPSTVEAEATKETASVSEQEEDASPTDEIIVA